MNDSAIFAACVALAPDFRVGIEYLVGARSLVWRGALTATSIEYSGGYALLVGTVCDSFEAKYSALLRNALLTLQKAAGVPLP